MNHEQLPQPVQQKPAEQFGLTENEQLFSRVSEKRFLELLADGTTLIHSAKETANSYGDFLFVTVTRPGEKERIGMTFYGLGYHEYRERLIKDEWFLYQTDLGPEALKNEIPKEEVEKLLKERASEMLSAYGNETQSQIGAVFELIADIGWALLAYVEEPDGGDIPEATPLMDENIRQTLPVLYSQEEQGMKALARVKYFTPDNNWTWYASEFDGEDTFFGLVSGLEVELGYFSLKELKDACGPMGQPIERDLDFEPKTLKELADWHKEKPKE
jgi:hypothetical protein